jgi:diguanylate cyclase (GGDEF)-like protein/PAS domain S-box-containing protein
MTLRKRLFWLFTPLLALTLLCIYVLSERILLSRFDRQDQQTLFNEAKQLHLYLDTETQRHLNMLRSYAWWNESYDFVQQPQRGFIQQQLQSDVLINLAFDFMVYYDEHGKIVGEFWSPPDLEDMLFVGDQRPDSQASLRQAILLRSQRLGALENRYDAQHALAQLVVVQGIPTLLLSSPISNSQGTARPVGVIIAGHILNGQRLEQLQKRSQGALSLLPPSAQAVDWQYLPSEMSTAHSGVQLSPRHLLADGSQQVELMYRNPLGEAELRMEVRLPRLLYQEGYHAIRFFLGAALLVACSAILLLYLGLERWILRRVQRMHREIAVIGHDPLPARLSDQGRDELGELARELNSMLERLQQSEGRDRAILDSIQDGYFEIDNQGKILQVNAALGSLLAYPSDWLIGTVFEELLGAEQVERARKLFAEAMQTDDSGTCIFAAPFKRGDGRQTYCEIRFSPIIDLQGQVTGYHGILRDISEQIAYQNRLIEMAYRDTLTSLGNRKAFAEHLNSALDQAQRQQTLLALMYIDLDRFKEVNDRFGHDTGDALLMAIAERMRNTLRQPDRVYRLGGDEFTLLMPHTSREAAEKLAERVLAALGMPFHLNAASIDFVTPSIGIALYPEHAQTAEALIKAADNAMYQAKQQRNCAHLYDVPATSKPSTKAAK